MPTQRLPTPQDDIDVWGNILNNYLLVSHDSIGSLKSWTNSTRPVSPADGTTGINTENRIIEKFNEVSNTWSTLLDFRGSFFTQNFVLSDLNNPSNQARFSLNGYSGSNAQITLLLPARNNATVSVFPSTVLDTSFDGTTAIDIQSKYLGRQQDEIFKFRPSSPLLVSKTIALGDTSFAVNGQKITLSFIDVTPTLFNGFSYIITGAVGGDIVVNTPTTINLAKFSTGWERI